MRRFSASGHGRVAIAVVVGATAIVLVLVVGVIRQNAKAACNRWREEYAAAVLDTARAIQGRETEPSETFTRLNRLDENRPEACPTPVKAEVRPRCLECGHQ
jgi:hypothetical protein